MAVDKYAKRVAGKKKADILMFTLSTCGWCMKTKKFLKDIGVEYRYIDVDLLEDEDVHEVEKEFGKWNPKMSFPTIVIGGKNCVIGFQEEDIRKYIDES
jgi:glutaredoxin-like protein NrdH